MPVTATPTVLDGVLLLEPARFGDARGAFAETWSARDWTAAGVAETFVQDNHARSAEAGTLRGLHFQAPPHDQGKLVRVTRGAAYDVAVDLRAGSPTFARHVAVTLSAEAWMQLWIPPGFAHGYLTLEPGTEVLYKTTAYYAPDAEGGLAWDDPDLAIAWPWRAEAVITSVRDQGWPRLADFKTPFVPV